MTDSFDMKQVDVLCDDLTARADTAQAEQHLLMQLIVCTADTRPSQSRHYQALLEYTYARHCRLRELVARYRLPQL